MKLGLALFVGLLAPIGFASDPEEFQITTTQGVTVSVGLAELKKVYGTLLQSRAAQYFKEGWLEAWPETKTTSLDPSRGHTTGFVLILKNDLTLPAEGELANGDVLWKFHYTLQRTPLAKGSRYRVVKVETQPGYYTKETLYLEGIDDPQSKITLTSKFSSIDPKVERLKKQFLVLYHPR